MLAEGLCETGGLVRWLPNLSWDEEAQRGGVFKRLFSAESGRTAIAMTNAHSRGPAGQPSKWLGKHDGSLVLYVNGKVVYSAKDSGEFQVDIPLAFGDNEIVVRSTCKGSNWGYTLKPVRVGQAVSLIPPFPVEGLRIIGFIWALLRMATYPNWTNIHFGTVSSKVLRRQ